MKLEVRLYGARNLTFNTPQGVWEASCILTLDATSHSIVLPKTAPKLKNTNPVFNRALHFEVETLESKSLNIKIMETSDTGEQSVICQKSIPLTPFANNNSGQEIRQIYPFQNGSDVDLGVLINTPGQDGKAAANAGNNKAMETVGPYAKKEYVPAREVVKFKPDDLKRLTPHLAKGSFGVVFKGWARGITQMVVIKDMEIQSRHSIDEWQKEIKIMAQTKSNYIAEVYGYSNREKTLTIVMEFMENGDLFGVLHKYPEKHPLSLVQRMRMARHCALGLKVMHEKKFMHRDIKSMNILVDVDYTCKLTDFGCSKLVSESDNAFLHTANTGTPLWMAPEVKRGEYGFASDIYSMGLVLYELFERKIPNYDQNSSVTSLPKHFQSAPVVLPCVSVNPKSRPNIEQVIVQLDKLLRRITEAVKGVLSPEEKEKLQQATKANENQSQSEAEMLSLYQYLLKKPPAETDKLIALALSGGGQQKGATPPASAPASTPNSPSVSAPQSEIPAQSVQEKAPQTPSSPLPPGSPSPNRAAPPVPTAAQPAQPLEHYDDQQQHYEQPYEENFAADDQMPGGQGRGMMGARAANPQQQRGGFIQGRGRAQPGQWQGNNNNNPQLGAGRAARGVPRSATSPVNNGGQRGGYVGQPGQPGQQVQQPQQPGRGRAVRGVGPRGGPPPGGWRGGQVNNPGGQGYVSDQQYPAEPVPDY